MVPIMRSSVPVSIQAHIGSSALRAAARQPLHGSWLGRIIDGNVGGPTVLGLFVVVAMLLGGPAIFYGIDRLAAWQQRHNFEKRRRTAEQPITANDPTG